MADQVPHDEEVRRETHLADHAQLVVDPLLDLGGQLTVATVRPLGDEVAEIAVLVPALRNGEPGQQDLPELQIDRGPFGDEQGVVGSPGITLLREEVAHLARRFQIELLRVETETVLITLVRPGLDAEKHIVGFGLARIRVVAVIRREQRSVDVPGDLEQIVHDLLLGRDPVVLHLDEEVLPAEDILVHAGRLEGGAVVAHLTDVPLFARSVGGQQLGNVAPETPAPGDDPLAVLRKDLGVHARLVVVAVQIGQRRQLHQVAVAGVAHRQQGHVIADVFTTRGAIETRAGGEVSLDADDRLDPNLLSGLVEIDHAVEHPVVGDRHRRLPVVGSGSHEILDPRRTVEHRELGVHMQMSEAVAGQRFLHRRTTPM